MKQVPRITLLSFSLLIAATLSGLVAADEFPEPIGVFVAGAEDIDGVEHAAQKYPQYREHNIVVTNSGKLVVVCQGRNKSRWSDRSGQDLVVKTSTDSGKTWSQGRLIATHGLKSICPNAAVYDGRTNRIHVLYNLFMWDFTNVPKDIRGEMGDLNCRQFVVTSDDEGATWSQPREISDMVQTHGAVMVVGSGEGIQIEHGEHKGRLIIAGGDFYQGKKVLCFYSDDHGKKWQRSEPVPYEGKMAWASESKLAELSDGTLVLNSRTFVVDDSDQRLRTRAFSRDGGLTWTRLENDPALKTVSCNGSLIAVSHPQGKDGTILLCSVPVGPGRTHGTVYVSFDGGHTWPHSKVVVPTAFAYSSLMHLPDGHIGLFYESEGYARIELVRFSVSWLLDSNAPRPDKSNGELTWSYPPDLPNSIGYAGPFVGVHQGALLVAGGANFCRTPLVEGGEKIWHDKVFVLAGKTTKDEASTVKKMWMLDLAEFPAVGRWQELTPWPGKPRANAVVATHEFDGNSCLFVFSGVHTTMSDTGNIQRDFLTDAYRYDANADTWRSLASLPVLEELRDIPYKERFNGQRWPIAAGCATRMDQTRVIVFGGTTGRYIHLKDGSLTPLEDRPLNSRRVITYDVAADAWSEMGQMDIGVLVTSAVRWNGQLVIPSGETKPGIRTPKVQSALLSTESGN